MPTNEQSADVPRPRRGFKTGFATTSSTGWTVAASLILIVACGSCRGRPSGQNVQEQVNLSWLGHMYGMYVSQNKGQTPKSVEELRNFVELNTSTDRLTHLKVANVGELFVSPRDGKPFTMVTFDKPPAMKAGELPPVVLYETAGQNGQRAVAYLGGNTRTIDEQELQKLLPASSKRGP